MCGSHGLGMLCKGSVEGSSLLSVLQAKFSRDNSKASAAAPNATASVRPPHPDGRLI